MFSKPIYDSSFEVFNLALVKTDMDGWIDHENPDYEEAQAALRDVCIRYFNANVNIQEENPFVAQELCRTYVSSPDALVAPPNRVSIKTVKVGNGHKDFKKRSQAGEILVSDYENGVCVVTQKPGLMAEEKYFNSCVVSVRPLVDAGLLYECTTNGRSGRFGITGTKFRSQFSIGSASAFAYNRTTVYGGVWVYPNKLTADTVMKAVQSHKRETTHLVTRTTAKANRSSVDLLTAMAEMPETVRSVLKGFKFLIGAAKDVKQRKFNISKGYAVKNKRTTEQYLKRMKRLDAELSSDTLSSKRRKALEAHRKRVAVTHRDALTASANELASALANVWLNFRYNIMTNVYLAQDVYDAVTKYGRQFITARNTERFDASIPLGNDVFMSASHVLKCMIKRGFTKGDAKHGGSVISADIFLTAWELVPLSFVYDWFINFGDFLAAQSYFPNWSTEGNTLSYKTEFDCTVDLNPDYVFTIEPVTHIRGAHYRREVINPFLCTGLVWQPTLGLERQIDAVALLWSPVRSLLIQGKRDR